MQKVESKIENLSEYQKMIDIPKSLDEPEYQLPDPDKFMSAKTYKTKIAEPLIDKLKKVVKTVLAKYLDLVSQLYYEQSKNSRLYNEIDQLNNDIHYYKSENKGLYKNANKYKLLYRAFGRKQIDSLLEQARQQRQNKDYYR